jgi:hypothetical protein
MSRIVLDQFCSAATNRKHGKKGGKEERNERGCLQAARNPKAVLWVL